MNPFGPQSTSRHKRIRQMFCEDGFLKAIEYETKHEKKACGLNRISCQRCRSYYPRPKEIYLTKARFTGCFCNSWGAFNAFTLTSNIYKFPQQTMIAGSWFYGNNRHCSKPYCRILRSGMRQCHSGKIMGDFDLAKHRIAWCRNTHINSTAVSIFMRTPQCYGYMHLFNLFTWHLFNSLRYTCSGVN